MQPGRVDLAAADEALVVPGDGETRLRDPERPRDPPGAQVEILDVGVPGDVPVVSEVERLAGEVGAKRAERVPLEVERVEIPARRSLDAPGGLPGGRPGDVPLGLDAEGIARQELPDRIDARIAEVALCLEEPDRAVPEHRGSRDMGGLE